MEPTQTEMCKCGHSAHWHGDRGFGCCEFDGDCECWRFRARPTAVALFREYRLDHDAALEPCLACLIDRCPADELDALHALLEAYMEGDGGYRRPPYSPVQMRRQREKLKPIMERAMNDPAVIADQDQREAQWRDTPWVVKRFRRARFWLLWDVRLRVRRAWHWRDPKPWE